jgi:hypothetical protein
MRSVDFGFRNGQVSNFLYPNRYSHFKFHAFSRSDSDASEDSSWEVKPDPVNTKRQPIPQNDPLPVKPSAFMTPTVCPLVLNATPFKTCPPKVLSPLKSLSLRSVTSIWLFQELERLWKFLLHPQVQDLKFHCRRHPNLQLLLSYLRWKVFCHTNPESHPPDCVTPLHWDHPQTAEYSKIGIVEVMTVYNIFFCISTNGLWHIIHRFGSIPRPWLLNVALMIVVSMQRRLLSTPKDTALKHSDKPGKRPGICELVIHYRPFDKFFISTVTIPPSYKEWIFESRHWISCSHNIFVKIECFAMSRFWIFSSLNFVLDVFTSLSLFVKESLRTSASFDWWLFGGPQSHPSLNFRSSIFCKRFSRQTWKVEICDLWRV